MDQNQVREYLKNKPFALETSPSSDGVSVSVFKVKHKMFATLAVDRTGKVEDESIDEDNVFWRVNLKCDPQEAIALRNTFPSVIPGYHMSKVHWNTVKLDGSVPNNEIQRMMDNSFNLVVSNMIEEDQQAILEKL